MNVLQITNNLDIGFQGGGAETFCALISMELVKKGCKVILSPIVQYGTEAETLWVKRLQENDVKVIYLTKGKRKNVLEAFIKALWICRTHKVTIVHSHAQIGSIVAVLLKGSRQVKKAYRTAHASLEWGPGTAAAILRAIFSKLIFPLAFDVQIGVSRSITSRMSRYMGTQISRKPVLTIPPAVSPERYEKAAKYANTMANRESEIGAGGTIIISIGRLTKLKGYSDLIAAIPMILNRHPSAELWLVGEGDQYATLNDLADQLKVSSKIKFLGSRDDVIELLGEATLFVLPSYQEGFPIVLLECMASCTPIIATNIDGVNEAIEDGKNGWLVEPGNILDLANTINEKLDNPALRAKVVKEAFQRVKKFTIELIGIEYWECYQKY